MIHAGARPVFCDIDDTYTIDPEDARRRITKRTVGILPVHLYGRPANLDALMKLARDNGLWIIEDCAQSHGAKWKGKRAGSFTEHAAFSFYPSKNLTVYGDGGAIATSDPEIARKVTMPPQSRPEGQVPAREGRLQPPLQRDSAAVGREQLKVLDQLNANRRRAAEWYRRELTGVKGLVVPPTDKAGETESVYPHVSSSAWTLTTSERPWANTEGNRASKAACTTPCPTTSRPAIEELYGKLPSLPKTEDYTQRILSLP